MNNNLPDKIGSYTFLRKIIKNKHENPKWMYQVFSLITGPV